GDEDLRQSPGEGPPALDGLLRGAGLHVQQAVHRRHRGLHGDLGRHLRDAAHPREVPGVHPQGDRRRDQGHGGAHLPLGRQQGGGGPARGRRAGGRRDRGARADGLRRHVRPQLPRPRRPHLGGHLDGPEPRAGGL
ncbi:MAG: Glyoxalase family protein, partial [uncultured Acetobacteraceae bacterium]